MKNKLVIIGWMGDNTCYLNVSKEEAVRRWKAVNPESYEINVDSDDVRELEFEDEFGAYDIWSTNR